jgi:hypothetical protein
MKSTTAFPELSTKFGTGSGFKMKRLLFPLVSILFSILAGLLSFFVACSSNGGAGDDDDSDCSLVIEQRGSTQICDPAGVRVTYSVSDCEGNPISGLSESNFKVINDEKGSPFESEGQAAAIMESLDFDFFSILVLDMSDSIVNNNRQGDVIQGARVFIKAMVEDQAEAFKNRVAILVFGGKDHKELVSDFTSDENALYQALDDLEGMPGLGTTDLYGAFIEGLNRVESQGSSEMVVRSLAILTDGTDEAGVTTREEALSTLASTEVYSYSIGIKGDYDEDAIRELASNSAYFFLVEDVEEIENAFQEIADYVEAWSKSNYVMGVCSPLQIANVSLTIQVEYNGMSGILTVPYDASNFDLMGCDSESVAQGEGCEGMPSDDDATDDDDDDSGGDVWTDSSSGLMWQNASDCCYTWAEAKNYCQNLNWGGFSDWRLPTISELRSLIRGCPGTVTGGACGVTDGCTDSDCWNDPCVGCDSLEGPGEGGAYWPDGMSGEISWYWSSSPVADFDDGAWRVGFYNGRVYASYVYYDGYYARCVR